VNLGRRRQLVAIAGAAIAAPQWAFSQAPTRGKPWRIGYLAVRSRPTPASPDAYYEAFVRGLRELGYVEGKNIVIEWRFADGRPENLPRLAEELVKLNLDVLVTHSTPAAQVVQRATRSIPVVFIAVGNPVESGLAASLARPGGNVTGQANMTNEVSSKQLELLKNLLPSLARVAALVNPVNATGLVIVQNLRIAAQRLGITVLQADARTVGEIDEAFVRMSQSQIQAVIVAPDSLFIARRTQIAQLALSHRLASAFAFQEDAAAGGLVSYGPAQTDIYRRGAVYVDRILRGANPGELPIEQPTVFELAFNARTASQLNIRIPPTLLTQADRVID
jgi:putative ABC transport system substrate-binding protein